MASQFGLGQPAPNSGPGPPAAYDSDAAAGDSEGFIKDAVPCIAPTTRTTLDSVNLLASRPHRHFLSHGRGRRFSESWAVRPSPGGLGLGHSTRDGKDYNSPKSVAMPRWVTNSTHN